MNSLSQIREISTLSFNERVLQEAEDVRNPLMERLKFLGIFSSNMDEFFKVRVASIQRRIELGKKGMAEVFEEVADKARELDERFRAAYAEITAGLAREGVRILTEADIDSHPEDLAPWLKQHFKENVLPTLVPLILYKAQPFPQLVDGALYIAVVMSRDVKKRYAIIEIPSALRRFAQLPNGDIMYVDDVIRYSLNELFYIFQYDRIEAFEFKISRDAELDVDDDFSEGYVRKMERGLAKRKGGRPTRLVYDEAMPREFLDILCKEFKLSREDALIAGGRYHNMKDLMRFPTHRPDLAFEKMPVAPHPVLDHVSGPLVDTIAKQDLLVTYPYQSFDHIVRLLREAAIDPKVRAISMTIYRVAERSQIVNALANAARNGKRVLVSIELLARFNEEDNIEYAERLKEAGAIVVYGMPPMKVHSKLLLIERDGARFAALSTGNYNETTAKLYVDSTLMTADPRITGEVADVFDLLEDAARMRVLTAPKFKHLLVSPFNSRKTLQRYIEREKAKGKDGYLFIKINHLTDAAMVKRLLEAADAGVRMDLVVRTTYALPPHKNIRAISILDRYLEHQRAYIIGDGDDRRVYLSSADLMERNLDWRMEVAFPIYDKTLQQEVVDMMDLQIRDTMKARILDKEQSNPYAPPKANGVRAQYATHDYFAQKAATQTTEAAAKPAAPKSGAKKKTKAKTRASVKTKPKKASSSGKRKKQ